MAKRRGKGEGSILKRKDGTWQGQVSLGYDNDGKRRRVTVYGDTQREVREKLDKIKQQIVTDSFSQERLTTEAYLWRWHEVKSRQVKPRTVELYEKYIRTHINPRVGRTKLSKLTALQVQTMVGEIADTAGVRTANICRTILFSALKQAVRWQLLPRNVVEAVDPLKETPTKMKLWMPAEARRFLDTAREHRLYPAFYLLMSTGLRRGELLGLRWDAVQGDMLRVEQSLSLVKNKPTLSLPKTERSIRRVALSPDIVSLLAEHRERQAVERAYLGNAWTETGLVFTSEVGTALHPRNFERTWYTLLARAGVTKIRMHDLRHLHVSLLVKEGFDPRTIADRVGHIDPAFTMRRYSHMFEDQRRRAAVSLDELLGGEGTREGGAEDAARGESRNEAGGGDDF